MHFLKIKKRLFFRQTFDNISDERDFWDFYQKRSFKFIRIGFFISVLLISVFGILDAMLMAPWKESLWMIRYFIMLPVVITAFLISFISKLQKYIQFIVFFAGLTVGLCIISMMWVTSELKFSPYYAGILLVIISCYTFLNLRFYLGTLLSFILFVSYQVVAVLIEVPFWIIVNNNFFLIGTIIVSGAANLNVESLQRASFVHINQIHADKTELESLNNKWSELAIKDHLTHLFNRYYLDCKLDEFFIAYQYHGHTMSIVLIDLDGFKLINDHFGHEEGDKVLKGFSKILLNVTRKSDFVFRQGGDEFCVLLPNTGAEDAQKLIVRAHGQFQALLNTVHHNQYCVRFSGGCDEFMPEDNAPSDVLVRADKLLYQAKNQGKGKVLCRTKERGTEL